ncbi:hypothetical protein Y1Q_0016084 [Alligator mississippiensis]|uniref:SCAN box domain-containing protein n=1 Tax=Alligator mississippiensis TaxID=8496 RepID=A0A151P2A6_ALLMI|nr:hypothetical protein Y1Q_0016084 [Alligator mississippiensis]
MPKMTKDDDPEAYIEAFEQDDAQDYEHVKEAILYKMEINPEQYRRQFRAKKGPEEKRPRVLLQLLRDLLDKWLACEMLLGRDWTPVYDVLDRVRDMEVARMKIQNQEGWVGEIEENEGSADETDELDLNDFTSSLQFREAQEEDQKIRAL